MEGGTIDFDRCLATEDTLAWVKPLGRYLGPLGLMPTAKNRTLVPVEQLQERIRALRQNMVEFR